PPGLSISSLARIVGWTPRVAFRSRTSGVCPTASRNVSMTSIARAPTPNASPYCRTGEGRHPVGSERLDPDPRAAASDRGKDHLGGRSLDDVVDGSRVHHLEDALAVRMSRERHHDRGRGAEEDLAA